MRPRASIILILLLAGTAGAQAPNAEREAYTNVRKARDLARRVETPAQIRAFRARAERFLEEYPASPRLGIVRLWLGDLLKETDPRQALRYYRASDWPDAANRARDLEFLFEPPPPLAVERWIGEPVRITEPDDKVTLLFFFSIHHPQSAGLRARLEKLEERIGARDLRTVGVASVVDEHRRQTPERIVSWVRDWKPGFPVAVDRQRDDEASVSLRRYRGKALPWGAFLDRYGRLAWIGPLTLEANALQQSEARLRSLLAEPGYGALENRGRDGDRDAIRTLGTIKTRRGAATLFAIRAANPGDDAKKAVDEALRGMLPEGYGPDDAERWKRDAESFRYSFEADRLVRAKHG